VANNGSPVWLKTACDRGAEVNAGLTRRIWGRTNFKGACENAGIRCYHRSRVAWTATTEPVDAISLGRGFPDRTQGTLARILNYGRSVSILAPSSWPDFVPFYRKFWKMMAVGQPMGRSFRCETLRVNWSCWDQPKPEAKILWWCTSTSMIPTI
jgi:hypothetical protein